MHTHRMNYKGMIIEFLPPCRRDYAQHNNIMILCDGMPSVPNKKSLMEWFSAKGYWVFYPRYRGTWESTGTFLSQEPFHDIVECIDVVTQHTGFVSIWTKEHFVINPGGSIYVIGASFGGSVALLSAMDPRVTKSIAIAPIVDWRIPSEREPLDWLQDVLKQSFGEAYRFDSMGWQQLSQGNICQPIHAIANIPPQRIAIIHASDDPIAPYIPSIHFASQLGAIAYTPKRGGHLSLSCVRNFFIRRFMWNFFRSA